MAKAPNAGRGQALPSVFYNVITVVGTIVAATSLALILFLMALETLASEHKPYMGVIAFVILPIFLVLGVIVAALGVLREHSRRRRGLPATRQLPIVNLNDPRQRRAAGLIFAGALVYAGLTAFGSYKAYEYTDSDAFCGTTCHRVMAPEHIAYTSSPHARVGCVKCHIGPGAEWFVRAKLSGLYQVYATVLDKYPRPIETPIRNLRPSRVICEQCHWPEHFYSDNFVENTYFASDEANSRWKLDMLLKIGGGADESRGTRAGVHYHMYVANRVEYVALDERRQEIPWIRTQEADGAVKVYRSSQGDFDAAALDTLEVRTMDCIDCHNRPAHRYEPPPRLVNQAMARGGISPDLPSIKEVAVSAMERDYATTEEAEIGIEEAIRGFYERTYPELVSNGSATAIEQAVATTQRLYRGNFFPAMRVSWESFPDNIGHLYSDGCFRCHDGLHQTDGGEFLTRDCNICHSILAQTTEQEGERIDLGGVEYHHPEDIDEVWKEEKCTECHAP